jgi:hypothetical protein
MHNDRMLAAATAALLHSIRTPQYLSWLLGVVCLTWTYVNGSDGLPWPNAPLLSVCVLAICVTWWTLRATLDARLFDALSAALDAGQTTQAALADLDRALIGLGLIKTASARTLDERARSARRFALYSIAALCVQLALMITVACASKLS